MIPRRRGATLLELTTALAILSAITAASWPALRRARDTYAVRGARDALAAGVNRARAHALAEGGVRLVVDVRRARFWIELASGDTVGGVSDLARDHRVALSAGSGSGERVELRFDGLGIGRMTSRTFVLTRNSVSARLTVSAYGRVLP